MAQTKLTLNVNRLTQRDLSEGNIFNYDRAYQYFSLIKMYKILNTDNHLYFKNKIRSFQHGHNFQTRLSNTNFLTIPRMNFSKCQRSFLNSALHDYNKLPLQIKASTSLRNFKKEIKIFIKARIPWFEFLFEFNFSW